MLSIWLLWIKFYILWNRLSVCLRHMSCVNILIDSHANANSYANFLVDSHTHTHRAYN